MPLAYENLLKSVDESAQERERELREKALKAADEIVAGAKKEGAVKEAALLDTAKRAAETERNRQMFLAKSENMQQLIRMKEAQFLRAFTDAEKQLTSLRNDPSYSQVFRDLATEALQGLGTDGIRVHIDPRDGEVCKKTLADLKVSAEVIPDLKTRGGLVVATSDESITISNTVESRLERGKERLKKELYGILFGG